MNEGIVNFYYSQILPPTKSVAIAYVSTPINTPAQITNIDNIPLSSTAPTLGPGQLGVWVPSVQDITDPVPHFPITAGAIDYGVSVIISDYTDYVVKNQYFELTTQFAISTNIAGTPLYYFHQLPSGVTNATLLDISGNIVTNQPFEIVDSCLYHSCDGKPYRIRYVNPAGNYVSTTLLKYTPVLTPGSATSATQYDYNNAQTITMYLPSTAAIRFLQPSGYQVFPPYNSSPNTPWYLRIGYSVSAFPAEWAKMPFQPYKPYMLGTWVSGKVLDTTLVEFERPGMNPDYLPDILVFNADNSFKYALEGMASAQTTGTTEIQTKGSMYNWTRGMLSASTTDFYKARVDLSVTLDPTDIVFGFYTYMEPNYLMIDLDVNPYTNPLVKNNVINIYYKNDPAIPTKNIFYAVYPFDAQEGSIPLLTNDTNPSVTGTLFGVVVSGTAVGIDQFTVEDVRVRGGGLAIIHQDVPQAVNFWDLGYWDGKPWPIGGVVVLYLPLSPDGTGVQSNGTDTISAADVSSVVSSILPMGTMASIRYYDQKGNETIFP